MDVAQSKNPRYVSILAFVACVILVGGWLVRPRDVPESPPPVPSQTELQELARRTQRRSLESMTAYFASIAGQVGASLSYLPSKGLTGTPLDVTHIVTGPLSGTASVVVSTASRSADSTRTAWSPRLPLSVLEMASDPGTKTIERATSLPRAGDWLVAVWRTEGMPLFAAGNFRQTASAPCGLIQVREVVSSLSLTRAMIGGALVDMDGDVLGVVLPCRDRVAAIELSSVDELLKAVVTIEERVLARYGILLSLPSDDERADVKEGEGLFVREVWIETPADIAGVWPGDTVIALNGQAVASFDDVRPFAAPSDEAVQLQVQRGSRTVTLTVASPGAAVPNSSTESVGLVLEAPPRTYRIDSVLPGSRASRAGLQAGDRLVRINRAEPRSRQQVERSLASTAKSRTLLEIERDTRRIAIVLPDGLR